MLIISQLKHKWGQEKDSYLKKEVGDGVQKFVKDVLKSSEVFGLKEGLNSTKLEDREYEFKEEEKKKAARRADVVIFINPEIVIPMEIEKYQNIKAGEDQIIQYQLDWNEKSNRRYGILTDGYTWRFYNNNEFSAFTLEDIFDNTELFLDFWQEYIKPETYYLSFFEKKGQQSLLKEVDILNVENYRQLFFEDITKLIHSFKNKLQIEGYLENLDNKKRGKSAVEITYAYIIQFILYKTLVDNEFSKFNKKFKEEVESIFECLKAEQYGKILGIIDGISNEISKNIYHPFAKEQEFITQKLLDLIHKPKNELHEVSPWLDIFVFIKKYNFSNVKNEIFGYIYENYLKELYEDTKKGQYFTDPEVVNFMLKQIGYTPEEINKRLKNDPRDNYASIIDPSCGSGTFLYSAVDQIIKAVPDGSEKQSKKIEKIIDDNVFGLDIEEFPLYLAEMNILMRMLPLIINEKYNNPVDKKIKVFKTNDSIAEFQDTAIKNTLSDIEVAYTKSNGQMLLFTEKLNLGYTSYVRDEDDLREMKKSLENQKCPRRRFDFVIGNPPYMHYNECAKQGILVFDLIKQGRVKLNDIYGVNLHSVPIHIKKYRPNPNIYAFFIALGLALLKNNGRLCYIIPQTILTAGDLDVIRYHLAKFTTMEKIITFSGRMFIGRGLRQDKPVPTSSLIFVTRRMSPDLARHQVEVIHYKDANDNIEECLNNILVNKKIVKKKILQTKLLQNVSNWNFIKQDKRILDFYEEYKKNTDDISVYYNHATAEHYFENRFYFDGGYAFKEKDLPTETRGDDWYGCPKLDPSIFTIQKFNGFIPNTRQGAGSHVIKLRQANQAYNLLDSKYKIIWSTKNAHRFHFTDKAVIWSNIRLSGIGSNDKKELFYIFSLLNSIMNSFYLHQYIQLENEKDFLLPVKTIKGFVRVPKITEDNQFIKNEIIKRTEEVLKLEDVKLSDLIDFSKVMMQKFDKVNIAKDKLVLIKEDKKVSCRIQKDKDLVIKTIQEKFASGKLISDEEINLSDLKSLAVIDFEKQKELKDYIDDLVFALYFKVPIKKIGLDQTKIIKAACEENKFYKILEKQKE